MQLRLHLPHDVVLLLQNLRDVRAQLPGLGIDDLILFFDPVGKRRRLHTDSVAVAVAVAEKALTLGTEVSIMKPGRTAYATAPATGLSCSLLVRNPQSCPPATLLTRCR